MPRLDLGGDHLCCGTTIGAPFPKAMAAHDLNSSFTRASPRPSAGRIRSSSPRSHRRDRAKSLAGGCPRRPSSSLLRPCNEPAAASLAAPAAVPISSEPSEQNAPVDRARPCLDPVGSAGARPIQYPSGPACQRPAGLPSPPAGPRPDVSSLSRSPLPVGPTRFQPGCVFFLSMRF